MFVEMPKGTYVYLLTRLFDKERESCFTCATQSDIYISIASPDQVLLGVLIIVFLLFP